MLRERQASLRGDERGYTLMEVMMAVALFVLLIAIVVLVILGLLERWRVDATTNQLVADMRLAHTSAAEQLTDWARNRPRTRFAMGAPTRAGR